MGAGAGVGVCIGGVMTDVTSVYRFWHGWPIELPVSEQDKIDVLPKSEFKHKAAFYGKHYWDPWAASEHLGNYTWERNLTRWFNIRRVYAVACAIGLFAVHVGLLVV